VTEAKGRVRPTWILRTAALVFVGAFVAYVVASFVFEFFN
jgi:hypothetical protein